MDALPWEIERAEDEVAVEQEVIRPRQTEIDADEGVDGEDEEPACLLVEEVLKPLGEDASPDEALGERHLEDHHPGQAVDPVEATGVEQAEHVGELIDVGDLAEGGQRARQEDRGEQVIVEDDVVLVDDREGAAERRYPKQDLRRNEQSNIRVTQRALKCRPQ